MKKEEQRLRKRKAILQARVARLHFRRDQLDKEIESLSLRIATEIAVGGDSRRAGGLK